MRHQKISSLSLITAAVTLTFSSVAFAASHETTSTHKQAVRAASTQRAVQANRVRKANQPSNMAQYTHSQTLPYVVKKVLYSNPSVLQSVANQLAGKQLVSQAFADFLPTVDVTAQVGRERARTASINDRKNLPTQLYSVTVNQFIFDGFARASRYQSAKYQSRSLASESKQEAEATASEAADAYLDVMRGKRLALLAQRNVQVHERTLSNVRERYKGGVGRKSDVQLAIGRLAVARASYEALQGTLKDSRATFLRVVGEEPSKLSLPQQVTQALPTSLAQAKDWAKRYSPSIQLAEKAWAASRYDIVSARAGYFPTLDIQFNGTKSHNLSRQEGGNDSVSGNFVMTYNLFRGGRDIAAVSESHFREIAAFHSFQNASRSVMESVTQAWNGLVVARRRLPQLRSHVKSAEEVVAAYSKQVELGQRSLLDLLDSETELFNARAALVNGQYDLRSRGYTLLANIGILVKTVV